jgi:hypothetical protein
MNECRPEHLRQDAGRHAEHVTVLLVGAGMVFLVAVAAAYSLALGSTGMLATTGTVLVTIGLAGLVVVAGVTAARRSSPRGREGGSGAVQRKLVPIGTALDPDAELLRILDDVRFGDLNLRRRAPLHDRRGTA